MVLVIKDQLAEVVEFVVEETQDQTRIGVVLEEDVAYLESIVP